MMYLQGTLTSLSECAKREEEVMHGWKDSGSYPTQLEKRRRFSEELQKNSSGGSKGPDKATLAFWGFAIFIFIMAMLSKK
jgi:hypothetical protein